MTAVTQRPTMTAVKEAIYAVTDRHISGLQRGYLRDSSDAVSTLARLRRGAGKTPEQVPELWGLLGIEQFFQNFQSEPSPADSEAAETAIFLAVTLYALHQQSRRGERMHKPGTELGAAVRAIMPRGAIDESIRRRFVEVGMATSIGVLSYRLREIVSLLRRASQPMDYALLAQQLYQAQLPEGMPRVRQSWGHSFHAYKPPRADDDNGTNGETPSTEEDR